MVRVLKKEEHSAKRNEILDAALKLVYTKGYGKMTIQDILDQLKISKGAFYHYFDSKADVLEALVERMVVEQVQPQFTAIVQDPHMNALEKLQRYFDASVTWKTAQKDFVMELVKVWYSDENVLAREKVLAKMEQYVTPLFSEIIQQGVREGTFTTPYPEYASQVNINMIQSLGDTFARLLLSEESKQPAAIRKAAAIVAAYTDALERVLGAPPSSIRLMDAEALKEWFPPEASVGFEDKPAFEAAASPESRDP